MFTPFERMVAGRYLRARKPFGLEAFEDHGLTSASGDVLKAVVATISFLGHPFTVLKDAADEKSMVQAREAESRATITENVQEVEALRAENVDLERRAQAANARASAMDALVAQVSSAVGGK